MTTKQHRLELAARIMVGRMSRPGPAQLSASQEAEYCVRLADSLIKENDRYPVTEGVS